MRTEYVLSLITPIIGNPQIAEDVVEVLARENLLNLHYGEQAVGAVVEAFKEAFGTTKVSKYDRFAAHRLAEKHGQEAVVTIIRLLAQKSSEKFCPTVNSISQLEEKWVSALRFLRGGQVVEVE
ncbi:MAG TPA: hypothetical protein VFK03_03700 [Candidatus Saccharimonadales bacterium]|nr:hypothetical protein [Candidatus Saccharimonadales bacterium]